MTTIEKLYEVSRQLPDQLQTELLDFAEFLMQRTPKERKKTVNLGQKINQRFKKFGLEELSIPARNIHRSPPEFKS